MLLSQRVGIRIRCIFMATVYRRALWLSNAARRSTSTGQLQTLLSADAQKFLQIFFSFQQLWVVPFLVVAVTAIIYTMLGASIFVGLAILVLILPGTLPIAKGMKRAQNDKMAACDDRMRVVKELAQGIRVVKYYAWEPPFLDRIRRRRAVEGIHLVRFAYLKALALPVTLTMPMFAMVATFLVYFLAHGRMPPPSDVFASIALFRIIVLPFTVFSIALANFVQMRVSFSRLTALLRLPLAEPQRRGAVRGDPDAAIRIRDSAFAWTPDAEPTLHAIDVRVPKGSLVAIVGPVGSGKSSLLAAMLGEMVPAAGAGPAELDGSVAYVPQRPFVLNATVRENVIFGDPQPDEACYQRAIRVAQLLPVRAGRERSAPTSTHSHPSISYCRREQDIETMPAGDATEIGEKGVTLSGGQQCRVAVSRCFLSLSTSHGLSPAAGACGIRDSGRDHPGRPAQRSGRSRGQVRR